MTKRKRGRPRAPHRPVLAARVPEEFYARVLASAAISGRNASEELIWRARQSYEWEAAHGFCPYCGSRVKEQNKSRNCVPNDETVAALDELDAGAGRRRRGTSKQIVDAILHDRCRGRDK